MKCEHCYAHMTQFEYDCFDGLCSDCHEKLVKENIEFLKEEYEKEKEKENV